MLLKEKSWTSWCLTQRDLRKKKKIKIMDNKFLVIGIIFELILFFIVLNKIKKIKKMRTRQTPLPKRIIKNLKFK